MNVKEKLLIVQQQLKAPKNQHNAFGNYKYRSAEDILEAVKKLLNDVNCILTTDSEIKLIGERFYIEVTAALHDIESGEVVSAKGYAREEETKKGMDGSQITGSAMSYAKKYALGNLLLVDDTADSDALPHDEKPKPTPKPDAKSKGAPSNPPKPSTPSTSLSADEVMAKWGRGENYVKETNASKLSELLKSLNAYERKQIENVGVMVKKYDVSADKLTEVAFNSVVTEIMGAYGNKG